MNPAEIKIRYRGKFIGGKWMYSVPRTVELPIPFISRSEKQGEVLCNPVGVFPYADGMRLLDMSGADGPFVLEKEEGVAPDPLETSEDIVYTATSIVENPNPPTTAQLLGLKPLGRFGGRRRSSKRKIRADKGISRPFGAKKAASIPDNPQAGAEKFAPSPA